MTHHNISPQYITRDNINVTILDMIDPAHFVVKESPDLTNASSKARNFLEAEAAMQKFYASVDPGFFQLPLKDAIIVVLHEDKFYRARVIRILTLSAGHLFKVYLVDYGIECSVPRVNIYEIEKDFLHHPFQAVTFELLGIEPISLIMDKISLSITYGPVSDWDPSAAIYFKDLQKSMCSAYIEVQGVDDSQLYGKLFLCFESSPTKCINDELISKSFARFNDDCWKNIKTIESILKGADKKKDSLGTQSKICSNKNPEQVSFTGNLPEIESDDGEIKMMFINPADGKIVAESTLNQKTCTEAGEIPMLQNEMVPAKEIVPEICKSEMKSPSHFADKTSETEVQLMTQKHLQKLLNKKKLKSPNKPICNESTNNEASLTVLNNIVKDSPISCENAHTDVKNVINETVHQSESKDQTSKTEEKEKYRSMSQAQLIAEKRLMKLQLRKSLSPSKCTDKPEIPHNRLSDTFPGESCHSETPKEIINETAKEIINETPKDIQVQENESMKQLQKLQKKVRLKNERMKEMQKKELLQVEKPSSEFNEDEVNINNSCDSSVYDSDSGVNSFSSSSSTSDRIER